MTITITGGMTFTGGTVTSQTGYIYHTFTTSGIFTG